MGNKQYERELKGFTFYHWEISYFDFLFLKSISKWHIKVKVIEECSCKNLRENCNHTIKKQHWMRNKGFNEKWTFCPIVFAKIQQKIFNFLRFSYF